MAIVPVSGNASPFSAFTTSSASPAVNYAKSFAANTLIVVAYQNSVNSTTARATGATDTAGNSYTAIYNTSNTSRGMTGLLFCRLQFAVTSSTQLTFQTTGTQAAVYLGYAIGADGLLSTTDSSTRVGRSSAFVKASVVGEAWTTPTITSVPTGDNTGLLFGVFGFENDYGFATDPSASPSGSTFAGFKDGDATSLCSVGLAYRLVTATGSNTGPSMTSTSAGSAGADFMGLTVHFIEEPVIYAQNNVIEMF